MTTTYVYELSFAEVANSDGTRAEFRVVINDKVTVERLHADSIGKPSWQNSPNLFEFCVCAVLAWKCRFAEIDYELTTPDGGMRVIKLGEVKAERIGDTDNFIYAFKR